MFLGKSLIVLYFVNCGQLRYNISFKLVGTGSINYSNKFLFLKINFTKKQIK